MTDDKQRQVQAAPDEVFYRITPEQLAEIQESMRNDAGPSLSLTVEMMQAARDALIRADPPLFDEPLSITVEPCPKCGHRDGQAIHICEPDTSVLRSVAIELLKRWYVNGGTGSDALKELGRQLYEAEGLND